MDFIGALRAGNGPLAAPPNFQAPVIVYTNFTNLATAQPYFTPQNVVGGGQDEKVQTTYNWSLGVQHDLSKGMILQVPFNKANFTLPAIDSLGIGNTPPTLLYGFGAFNLDMSLSKNFKFGREDRYGMEFRVETFNTLNHFNPNNPNSGLTYNFTTGAQTNAAFGTIQGAQVQARRAIMSLRFKF